jgi:hypothetical protein
MNLPHERLAAGDSRDRHRFRTKAHGASRINCDRCRHPASVFSPGDGRSAGRVPFQGAANGVASTTELANLAGDTPLPTPTLSAPTGSAPEQISNNYGADQNGAEHPDAHPHRSHAPTLSQSSHVAKPPRDAVAN